MKKIKSRSRVGSFDIDTALVARALNLPVDGVNVERVGDSDSHPFAARKLRVIDFHSLIQENLRVLPESLK
jgi:hypothetical protein